MIDSRTEHRCLLREVADGHQPIQTRSGLTVQALILAGFLTAEKITDSAGNIRHDLQLTPAGHQYLAGLWH